MRAIILIYLLVINADVFAQGKLEYVFDRNADNEIKAFLRTEIGKDSSKKFYFVLSHESTEKSCGNYKLFIGVYKDAPLEFLSNIIKTSSRFYKFGDTQIPICFDYDFNFVGYGQNSKGVTRKNFVGEMFYIEFSNRDKIISKGY